MPLSKVNSEFEFNENKWVISLINTSNGIEGIVGGHAKIIVEGVKRKNSSPHAALELFIAEYHIMEANRIPTQTWLPQFLLNTTCNYVVLIKEENGYNARQVEQYTTVNSKSWFATPFATTEMINSIKQEQYRIDSGQIQPNFQYAGNWCIYSYNGGHNCTTWAEEKLAMAGVGNGILLTDSSKAAPALHVTCQII